MLPYAVCGLMGLSETAGGSDLSDLMDPQFFFFQ